jgi:hypothetical protein
MAGSRIRVRGETPPAIAIIGPQPPGWQVNSARNGNVIQSFIGYSPVLFMDQSADDQAVKSEHRTADTSTRCLTWNRRNPTSRSGGDAAVKADAAKLAY